MGATKTLETKIFAGQAKIGDSQPRYVTVKKVGEAFSVTDGAGKIVKVLESGSFDVKDLRFTLKDGAGKTVVESFYKTQPIRTLLDHKVTFDNVDNQKVLEKVKVVIWDGWVQIVDGNETTQIVTHSNVSRNGQYLVYGIEGETFIIDPPAKKKGCGCGK
jgi:hypothetical protein